MEPSASSASLSLPLRIWPKNDPSQHTLASLIPRISEQKGRFRNVTEENLEEDIRASNAGEEAQTLQSGEEDENSPDGEDEVGRKEAILAAREDILNQVGWVRTWHPCCQ